MKNMGTWNRNIFGLRRMSLSTMPLPRHLIILPVAMKISEDPFKHINQNVYVKKSLCSDDIVVKCVTGPTKRSSDVSRKGNKDDKLPEYELKKIQSKFTSKFR